MPKIDDLFKVDENDPIVKALSPDQTAWLSNIWKVIKNAENSLQYYSGLFTILKNVSQSQNVNDQRFQALIQSEYFQFITNVNLDISSSPSIQVDLDEAGIKTALLTKLKDSGAVGKFTAHNNLTATYPLTDYATAISSMQKLETDVKAKLVTQERVNFDQYQGTKFFFIRKSYPLRSGTKVVLQKLIAWLFDGADFEEVRGKKPSNVPVDKLPNADKQKAAIKALIHASRNFGNIPSRKSDTVKTIAAFIVSKAPANPAGLKDLKDEKDYRRLYDGLFNYADNIFTNAGVTTFFKALFMDCPVLLRNDASHVVLPGIRLFLNQLKDAYLLNDIESAYIDLNYDDNIVNYHDTILNDLLLESNRILENLPLLRKNPNPAATDILSQVTKIKLFQIPLGGLIFLDLNESDWPKTRPHFIAMGSPWNEVKLRFYSSDQALLYFEDRENPNTAWITDPDYQDGRLISVNFTTNAIGVKVHATRLEFKVALEKKFPDEFKRPYFKTRRQWHCLYDSNNKTAFLSEAKGGGGHGIGRADGLGLILNSYAHFQGQLPQSKLDELNVALGKNLNLQELGNKLMRFVTRFGQSTLQGDLSAQVKTEPMNDFTKVLYEHGGDSFVSTNTPSSAKKILARTTGEVPDALLILNLFRFGYFRKVDDMGLVTKDDKKNRPLNGKMNLPVDFKVAENYKKLHETKPKARQVIKNKGRRIFYQGPASRLNAGSVMKEIIPYIKDGLVRAKFTGQHSLSATKFTEALMNADNDAKADWQSIKGRPLAAFPTDQEWCHLKGHGGGGAERIGNFVSGSNHCNTEQLAIETGHRRVTLESNDYIVKSTAYLINNKSMKGTNITKNYLLLDKEVEKDAKKFRKNLKPRAAQIDAAKESAPIVAFIRYRIFKVVGQQEHKFFDYTFEGQSEFFDKNQYNILNHTVYFMLAGWDKFKDWFVDRYENG